MVRSTLPSPAVAAAADDRHAAADGHYFSESPTARHRPGRVVVDAAGDRFALATDAGTFSPRRLDPGTAFLLERAPSPPAGGTFLDLGCGYGPVALSLARRAPGARVVAVDVNARSRELCAANAAALGCANVQVGAPDDIDPDLRFDLIWSNPPIRVGKDALHDLLDRWLGRLTGEGAAVLVVGRNLGADSLQRWLDGGGWSTERLASRRGYRLLRVARA